MRSERSRIDAIEYSTDLRLRCAGQTAPENLQDSIFGSGEEFEYRGNDSGTGT